VGEPDKLTEPLHNRGRASREMALALALRVAAVRKTAQRVQGPESAVGETVFAAEVGEGETIELDP
jgi:hypothetical protein